MTATAFRNPFRPGAGHMPPHLAGRDKETEEFLRLLEQDPILENLVLTGLRGVGKTVLLDTLKPLAIERGWRWVGTDLSQSSSISEERLAVRLLTDLSVVTSSLVVRTDDVWGLGFRGEQQHIEQKLGFDTLKGVYDGTPGLVSDKLKAVLELAWHYLSADGARGLVFAYDEAQNLSDQSAKGEYPLSLMLDLFQSLQKKGAVLMLALAGLPTLFPKLVEARTFAERMFHVVFLDRLDDRDSRDAILTPIEKVGCTVKLSDESVSQIIRDSAGYPYFIQFICREVYDVFLPRQTQGAKALVPTEEILRKLDADFFAGRWARATDRQRELLTVVANLDSCDHEFTIQEVVEKSKAMLGKPFSASHVSQMLSTLATAGLVYKNRHGKYSFAVPLLGRFILRQQRAQSAENGTAQTAQKPFPL